MSSGGQRPFGLDQARIKNARFGIDDALDLDRVLPAIAKIVEVPQRLGTDILKHVAEAGLARVERPSPQSRSGMPHPTSRARIS